MAVLRLLEMKRHFPTKMAGISNLNAFDRLAFAQPRAQKATNVGLIWPQLVPGLHFQSSCLKSSLLLWSSALEIN